MPWTGTIVNVDRADDKRLICYTVVYTNGEVKESRRHSVNPADAKALIENEVAKYEAVDDALANPIDGLAVGDIVSAAKPADPPADPDRDAYFLARIRVQRIAELLADGSTHFSADDLTTATKAWNALPFLPSYEGLE